MTSAVSTDGTIIYNIDPLAGIDRHGFFGKIWDTIKSTVSSFADEASKIVAALPSSAASLVIDIAKYPTNIIQATASIAKPIMVLNESQQRQLIDHFSKFAINPEVFKRFTAIPWDELVTRIVQPIDK